MKIGVFGYHPEILPGFNSLMSANFCYGFAKAGHDVTMLLPEGGHISQCEKLKQLKIACDELDRFGAPALDICIVDAETTLEDFDLVVWQSYFQEDEKFWPIVRKAARIVTKNFPRMFVGSTEIDTRDFLGATDRFDIVGISLKSDLKIASDLFSDVYPDRIKRCIYQPRGFRSDWMLPADDYGGRPVFGIEQGVDTNGEEYAYLIPVIEELRRRHGMIEVIGARFIDPRITTRSITILPARKFYSQFLAPLWGYLMINVDFSRQSQNAVMFNGRKIYPGLYENQIVEAQMAGAVVMGQEDALPAELVGSDATGLRFTRYSETEGIIDFLDRSIVNREKVKTMAQDWARRHHSVDEMIGAILRIM